MHYFQDKVPIHGGPVDILRFDRWTRCTIGPADMSTGKALDILRSRQFLHQWYFPSDADDPLGHAPCCVSYRLLIVSVEASCHDPPYPHPESLWLWDH